MLAFYDKSSKALKDGATVNELLNLKTREKIGRFKYTQEDSIENAYENIMAELDGEISRLLDKEDA